MEGFIVSYNKKIAIVYKTKYGSTMKYAGWLAIKLNADLYEVSDVGRWDLLKYRTIVYGGPIYNSEIYGIDFILDRFQSIKYKNIIIFCVGLNQQSREEIFDNNFVDEEVRKKIKIFFLQGAMNYEELNKVDKLMMKKMIKNNSKRNKFYIKDFSASDNLIIDKMNKKSIEPILNYILKKTYPFKKFI